MGIIVIEDPEDRRLRRFRSSERGLADRADKRDDRGAGLFLAEGDLVVERALTAGCTPIAALVDAENVPPAAHRLGIDVFAGGERVRQQITRSSVVQSIVALFERPPRPSVDELADRAERLVVAEAVDNPANVGSIVRNAAGLGWHGLVLDHTSADPLARRALRVAMGTTFELPHARTRNLVEALRTAREHGFTIVALSRTADAVTLDELAHGSLPGASRNPSDDLSSKIALVVGAERAGISDEVLVACDRRAWIPMHGSVDSLNVAAATAIACYTLGPLSAPSS